MDKISFTHLQIKKPKKRVKDRQNPLWPQFEMNAVYVEKCPKCLRKLYWNRPRTIIRCKSKLHSFVLTAQKYNDIVSGKTLSDYKQFQKSLTK